MKPLSRIDLDLEVGVIRLVHKSVFDFLTTPGRADDLFLVNPVEHDQTLAVQCLSYMNTHLHRDICQIHDGAFVEFRSLSQDSHPRCFTLLLSLFCATFSRAIIRESPEANSGRHEVVHDAEIPVLG